MDNNYIIIIIFIPVTNSGSVFYVMDLSEFVDIIIWGGIVIWGDTFSAVANIKFVFLGMDTDIYIILVFMGTRHRGRQHDKFSATPHTGDRLTMGLFLIFVFLGIGTITRNILRDMQHNLAWTTTSQKL